MAAVEVVLIAVNQQDIASTNQGDRLRELDAWSEGPLFEDLMTFSLQHLRMVYLPNGLLFEDHLDRRWFTSTGERVTEVIFPSRHAAASGQASLTLHPIGVPHLDEGVSGRTADLVDQRHLPRRDWRHGGDCCLNVQRIMPMWKGSTFLWKSHITAPFLKHRVCSLKLVRPKRLGGIRGQPTCLQKSSATVCSIEP